jgi:hypothetical protein
VAVVPVWHQSADCTLIMMHSEPLLDCMWDSLIAFRAYKVIGKQRFALQMWQVANAP